MSNRIVGVFLVVALALASSGAVAARPARAEKLAAFQGDNTIYLTWDADRSEATKATSSRRLTAGQNVELLTGLVDRRGRIVMRAVLENISSKKRFRIDGRLVHQIFKDDEMVKVLCTKVFHTVLRPGGKIMARYTYGLPSGEYSIRTDYITRR